MLSLLLAATVAQADWRTHYERSGYVETGRYEEAVQYCRRLDAASEQATLIHLGKSPQGREIVALAISRDGSFHPRAAQRSKKPLILVINGIHSGEIEGKDASLILARDVLITKKLASLIDDVNLLIVPIFSVDAHERFNAYNRINQNGPKEMGWRATSVNLNLNRDWIKADALEMRHMLRLIRDWRPDFAFDNHTTNGGDWQYVLTYGLALSQTQHPSLVKWTEGMIDAAAAATDRDGFLTAPYFSLTSRNDPTRGITVQDFSPRYSHAYFAAINRPAVLVETHMLKPYRQRVEATLSFMRHVIGYCGRTGAELKSANASADREASMRAPGEQVVLDSQLDSRSEPFTFKGYPYEPYRSEVTGTLIPSWRQVPTDFASTIRRWYRPAVTVEAPAAYAVPPQCGEVLDLLELHGIKGRRLPRPFHRQLSSIEFTGVSFPTEPFEGRHMPRFQMKEIVEERELPAGTLIVPVAQPLGKLALHLFEPAGPDSLVRWGFFNSIFEQKEYFETYAFEPIAKKMLAADPILRAEFEERLKDPAFAESAQARLQFLWERSPYADERLRKYPVVRLNQADLARLSL
ncbi:MAG TPA: M14 family metallopeptidase [Fimbriimonadaceae bacterium]|nr:M14 family metallopeptidase [Fimbriimonadaceae bacterium]